jgi:tetratricopeptide (TPR) repeat protein
LEVAATLGPEFSIEVLGRITELSSAEVLEAIEELLAARLFVENSASVDRFAFPHALVRNAVYGVTAEARRCQLHLRAGEALEALSARTASDAGVEIAYHYWKASPLSTVEKASYWAERAAGDAARRFAFAEAVEWYERALQLSAGSGAPSRGAMYLALGLACDGSRQFSRASDAFVEAAKLATETQDAELLADIAIAAAPTWTSGLEPRPYVERLLEQALDLLEGTDPVRRIQLLARLATLLHYLDPQRQRALVDEACSLAQQDDAHSASIAVALLARHLSLTHDPGERLKRRDVAEQASVIASQLSNPATHLRVRRELLADLLESGKIDTFDRELESYEAQAKAAASARDRYWSMALRATQATLRGDLSLAEQLARGALLRGRELHQDAFGAELLQRFVLRYQQGRLKELVGGFRQATDMQPAYRAGSALAAVACAETGHLAEGVRIARWAIGPEGTEIQRDVLWLGSHALLCGVAARAGHVELSQILHGMIAPYSDHIVIFGAGGAVLGPAHYWCGLVAATSGNLDCAVEHLDEAIRISERIRAPFWAAQSQIDLAAVSAGRGRHARRAVVRELTARAVATAREHHFDRILIQAQLML